MMDCGFVIPHETAITLVFWRQQWLLGDAPFPLKSALKLTHPFEKRRLRSISAHNVSTVRDSEKCSVMTNIKSTTGFPTSYRCTCTLPLSPKRVAQKAIVFVFGNKSELQSNKVCYKVSSCENFQRHGCRTTTIPASNGPSQAAQ